MKYYGNRDAAVESQETEKDLHVPKGNPVVTGVVNSKFEHCAAIPFNMTYQYPYCEPVVVPNNYCYGQCRGFYIPDFGDDPETKLCSSCVATGYQLTKVSFKCFTKDLKQIVRSKIVMIISKCACEKIKCPRNDNKINGQ